MMRVKKMTMKTIEMDAGTDGFYCPCYCFCCCDLSKKTRKSLNVIQMMAMRG
jgi:hypothetical protein